MTDINVHGDERQADALELFWSTVVGRVWIAGTRWAVQPYVTALEHLLSLGDKTFSN